MKYDLSDYKLDQYQRYVIPADDDLWDHLQAKVQTSQNTGVRYRMGECFICHFNPAEGYNNHCFLFNVDTLTGHCLRCGAKIVRSDKFQRQVSDIVGQVRSHHNFVLPECGSLLPLSQMPQSYQQAMCIDRGLPVDFMEKYGVMFAASHTFVSGEGMVNKDALAFLFRDGDVVRNIQYRSRDKKFMMCPKARPLPWNLNDALCTDTLVVTEGMYDALTVKWASGEKTRVISLPNGAGTNMEAAFGDYAKTHFDDITRFVYAGDLDAPGSKICEKFVKWAGADRCWVVNDWSRTLTEEESRAVPPSFYKHGRQPYMLENCKPKIIIAKDANELLMLCNQAGLDGKAAVMDCINNAKKCDENDVETIYDCKEALDEIHRKGIPDGLIINLKGFDDHVKWVKGCFYDLTGVPGTGKSTLIDNIIVRLACMHDFRTLVFSPEKFPSERHYAELVSIITGKPIVKVSDMAYNRAVAFLGDHIIRMGSHLRRMDDIIRTLRRKVKAEGIDVLVIDPFGYLEKPSIPNATDAEKISEMLTDLVDAMRELHVIVIMAAHPRKMLKDEKLTLYSISGSSEFFNKPDNGMVMWREQDGQGKDITVFEVQKSRYKDVGATGKFALCFDPENFRFYGCSEDKNCTSSTADDLHRYIPDQPDDSDMLDLH